VLLLGGGAIWLTNVIVFALWYWDLDRRGPVARARGSAVPLSLVFPEMSNLEHVGKDWYPKFVDYFFYFAFLDGHVGQSTRCVGDQAVDEAGDDCRGANLDHRGRAGYFSCREHLQVTLVSAGAPFAASGIFRWPNERAAPPEEPMLPAVTAVASLTVTWRASSGCVVAKSFTSASTLWPEHTGQPVPCEWLFGRAT
jgi:hypothetical protein